MGISDLRKRAKGATAPVSAPASQSASSKSSGSSIAALRARSKAKTAAPSAPLAAAQEPTGSYLAEDSARRIDSYEPPPKGALEQLKDFGMAGLELAKNPIKTYQDIRRGTGQVALNLWDVATTAEGRKNFTDSLVKGGVPALTNAMGNYSEMFYGTAAKGFEAIGADIPANWARQDKARGGEMARKANEEMSAFLSTYYDNTDERGFLEKISTRGEEGRKAAANVLGSQMPMYAAILASGFATKGTSLGATPGVIATSFALNSGDAFQQGKDYVASTGVEMTPEQEEQLARTAGLVGVTLAPLDLLGLDRILKPAGFKAVKSTMIRETMKLTLNGLASMGTEAVTEMMQEVIQNAWARTYNEHQDLFEGAAEAAFGGGIFGGGASITLHSAGLLRAAATKRLQSGKSPDEVKEEAIEAAEAADSPLEAEEIATIVDEAAESVARIQDVETRTDPAALQEAKDLIVAGATPAEAALTLSTTIDPSDAEVIAERAGVEVRSEQRTAAPEATAALQEVDTAVDSKILARKAADVQKEFVAAEEKQTQDIAELKKSVADLQRTYKTAAPADKVKVKADLDAARQAVKDAETAFEETTYKRAEATRDFFTTTFKDKLSDIPNAEIDLLVDEMISRVYAGGAGSVQDMVDAVISEYNGEEVAAAPEKKAAKETKKTEPKKKAAWESQANSLKNSKFQVERAKLSKNGATKEELAAFDKKVAEWRQSLREKEPGAFPGYKEADESTLAEKTSQTQKDKVRDVLAKKGEASIKEIAEATKILEPNIRRILGVGAKEGVFERVGEGVYRVVIGEQEVAVIFPGDAVSVLPELVKNGFKADMVFLDIPYDTPAVRGGNRGVKYELLSVEDFGKVLDSAKQILRTEDSALIHMYSQAKSGLTAMMKYNDLVVEKGFTPIARGDYTKLQKDGLTVYRNMRGMVPEPEGILVFNQSGKELKDVPNLNFKLTRPRGYQTEKPAEMLKALIEMTTEEGEVVLDPFAGSGVTIDEAVKSGRKGVGIEKKEGQAKKIKERVEKDKKEKAPVLDINKDGEKLPEEQRVDAMTIEEYVELTGEKAPVSSFNELDADKSVLHLFFGDRGYASSKEFATEAEARAWVEKFGEIENAATFESTLKTSLAKLTTSTERVVPTDKPFYHGTLYDFTQFDDSRRGENTGWDNASFGFFFTEDRARATQFIEDTRQSGDDRPPIVREVRLDIKNPLDLTTQGIFTKAEQAPLLVEITGGEVGMDPEAALEYLNDEIDLGIFPEFMEALYADTKNRELMEAAGYDGIVSEFGRDEGKVIREYVAFRGEQITLLDKSDETINDEDNGTNNDTGSDPDEGGLPEATPVGAPEPRDAGGAATEPGDAAGTGRGDAQRSGKSRKRPGARLTNAEIETAVKAITEVSTTGEITLTGEITEQVREAAAQYVPGGVAKEGRGVLDEYYTDAQIVDLVKNALVLPAGSLKVMEPSVGTGNFLYALPEMTDHTVVGLEINETTARIAKVFHPEARIFNSPFESLFMDDRGNNREYKTDFDLVVGNPPYGSHRGEYLGLGLATDMPKYEDFFIKAGLSVLKNDGQLAMVIPSSFMRSGESKAKVSIIARGELVAAYRLPNGVFAGTDIGTDILIFKKKAAGYAGSILPIIDDQYFKDNPQNILGTTKKRKDRFGKQESYVEGSMEDAITAFYAARETTKAVELLNELGVETTPDNIEEAAAAVEEAGDGATQIVKDEESAEKKAAKAAGKKTIEKKVVQKAAKEGVPVALTSQFTDIPAATLELWRRTTPEGFVMNPTEADKAALNLMDGQYYLDFNYLQGDIYEKLALLEADKRSGAVDETRYARQKAALETVLPQRETADDIKLSPNHSFVKDFILPTLDISLQKGFTSWLGTLPYPAFGGSSSWEIREYVENKVVTGSDKDHNELVRVRRKKMADSLFAKYLKEEIGDDNRRALEDAYNRTYNFFHTPDYSQVPMFSEILPTFKGRPFVLNTAQKSGIGRLVNTGVGILAHEVGFGKTISGALTAHEFVSRGWSKKPVIVVPDDGVAAQWRDTIMELVPNATVNMLGNLGVNYKGDLSSLKVAEGSFTILTFEGFKRLSFRDDTYTSLASKFSYITDDLSTHAKTAREKAQAAEATKGTAGKAKKGTRADLFFEDLGFDHLTFDELHNANHIVSKLKLPKGEASEYSRFTLRPSDLGLKTWVAAQYVQELKNGRNVTGTTATPFTNHPLEYYSILSLVADKSLRKMGFHNVNDFFGAFMEAEHEYEFKADGSYQKKTDVRGFKNYRQFRKLLDSYIDFRQDAPGIRRPNRIQKTYEVPQNELTVQMNNAAQAIFEENESEAGKGAKVLRAINEFRKIAFSPYASQFAPDISRTDYKAFIENSPKLATVMAILKQNLKDKPEAGQIIYSEVGIEFFPLIRDYLVKVVGLADTEVETITGATAKNRRLDVQARFNEGKVKVLIGSDAISEGLNLQENTTDMHLLSLPWNFTALRQVIGRAWRQGNSWKNVRINQYFIQDSIDIFLSQKLDNKQRRYEAATSSNANEVDVGDVSYNEMKSELIQDPQKRAQFEIQGAKEKLNNEISQITAETSFATRKLEKISKLMDDIAIEERGLADENAKAEPDEWWKERRTKNIATYRKELAEETAKLAAKDIDVAKLVRIKEEGDAKVVALREEVKNIEDTVAERTEAIVASLPPRTFFSQEVIDGFVAERAEHNKDFYTKDEVEVAETVAVEQEVKEIKNAAETKVLKKKTTTKVTKRRTDTTGTKDERVLKVLGDKTLSVSEKVESILNEKQTGKEFKDVGERVAGSKKERAAITTVMENGDAAVISEMINTLGAETVAATLQKDEILAEATVPNAEADQAAGVPAFVAGWKLKVLNSITRTPTLVTKRSKWNTMVNVDSYSMETFLTNYPTMLRSFVEKLAAVKTYEEAKAFVNDHRWSFGDVKFMNGEEEVNRNISISVLGRTIESAVKDISRYQISIQRIEEVEKVLADGLENIGDYGDGVDRYKGLSDWNLDTRVFRDKADAEESVSAENRTKMEERLAVEKKRLYTNYDVYLPKKKAAGEVDRSHGNFKPLDHIERNQPEIAETRLKPETLTKELGFKSVQLGNYMDDATAKEHIRYTIGAVEDLSKALRLDFPSLINKYGLSIAYGARGGGGANAHYEPTHNIINLTKGRGDGSFGHELMHFIDWKTNQRGYREKWSGGKTRSYRDNALDKDSLTLIQALTGDRAYKKKKFTPRENSYVLDNPEHPVMVARLNNVPLEDMVKQAQESRRFGLQDVADVYRKEVEAEMTVWNEPTDFYLNSLKIGGGNKESYWVRPHELLARAAQAYFEDKMSDAGIKNNYLTRSTIATAKGDEPVMSAYPQGEERARFTKLFDDAFAALQAEFPPTSTQEARFRVVETPELTVSATEAGKFLADFKDRMKLDFSVHFVDTLLAGYKYDPLKNVKTPVEAWGATLGNTILLSKEVTKHTAPHEVIHLTMNNLERIPTFQREGITKDGLLAAWRAKNPGKTMSDTQVEEALAYEFETFMEENVQPTGIIGKFFALLKRLVMRMVDAIVKTEGDIIRDYYETVAFGQAVENTMVELDKDGAIDSFVNEAGFGVIEMSEVEAFYQLARFKLKDEKDARMQKLKSKFNDLVETVEVLQDSSEAWKADITKELIAREQTAEVIAAAPDNVKVLSRFTKRTDPVGELTSRGEMEAEVLGFEDTEAAQAEVRSYLKDKVELIETRNRLRTLRRQIAQANRDKKTNKAVLRDIERKLRLRKRYLEQKDYYVGMGREQGKKIQMKMIRRRGRVIRDIQDQNALGDARAKKLLAGRRIHLMSEQEFDNFIVEFANRAEKLGQQLTAQMEVKGIIAERQFQKWENLQKAMGLPSVEKMSEEEASRFAQVLGTYQFGDVFLTKREIETVHRTNWGDAKTEREVLDMTKKVMGVGREELKTLTAPAQGGYLMSWIRLSRLHPFWGWLVNKRMEAKIQTEREYVAIEDDVNRLIRAARKSRRAKMNLGEKVLDVMIPTDDYVFGYMEAKDKEAYALANGMTNEELAMAQYLILQYHNAYEYLSSEYGMQERQDYITHTRRSFLEVFKEEKAFMPAFREIFSSQKEHEAAFKILEEQTGEILAFEKFFGSALARSGQITPSKNVARVSLGYFKALATKRALDKFIPEAMIAVQAHKAVAGTTPKGLSKDPTVDAFVKRFLNDAKGRKMDFGGFWRQGSPHDVVLRSMITLVSLKYLGLNLASAIGNVVGDFTAVFWELNTREFARGVSRSFQFRKAAQINKDFRYFTGRNPLMEMFDPQFNMPARVKMALMVLMAMAAFQSNKFFLRSKMTAEEFRTGVVEDARLNEIAQSLSRAKPNAFYVKSQFGNTTPGGASVQFGTWAVVIANTLISDSEQVMKMLKAKTSTKEVFTSKEAQQLMKFIILAGLLAFAVMLLDVDEEDDSLFGKTMRSMANNLNTLFSAVQFVTDPESYFLLFGQIVEISTFFKQVLSQEKYKTDGVGYGEGDPKWMNTGARIITPSALKQFFPKEVVRTKEKLVEQAIKDGNFDAETLAERLAGEEDWAALDEDGKERKVKEVTKLYNIRRKYPEDPMVELILYGDSNKEKIQTLLKLEEQQGEEVWKKFKKLYHDNDLCGGSNSYCLVSTELFKDYKEARKP